MDTMKVSMPITNINKQILYSPRTLLTAVSTAFSPPRSASRTLIESVSRLLTHGTQNGGSRA
jgi:hypothetical protein